MQFMRAAMCLCLGSFAAAPPPSSTLIPRNVSKRVSRSLSAMRSAASKCFFCVALVSDDLGKHVQMSRMLEILVDARAGEVLLLQHSRQFLLQLGPHCIRHFPFLRGFVVFHHQAYELTNGHVVFTVGFNLDSIQTPPLLISLKLGRYVAVSSIEAIFEFRSKNGNFDHVFSRTNFLRNRDDPLYKIVPYSCVSKKFDKQRYCPLEIHV
mmetsp:Transcript_12056/g.23024  ORF Transcript_12056/g.23024 Transcript_12056/m.23024 type:complete len:209 (-) Transcript_12056:610-1236(-)